MADIPNTYQEVISAFPGGMDSGTLPRLLSPLKAAFLQNATVRGGFPTDRSKFRKLSLTYESASLQGAVESGLFQGAGFFRSQSGIGSLMASISGRIFQIAPSLDTANVSERSIPGDTNSDTQPQAWFWQAEQFEIVTNGYQLPIFLDDATTRRSNGPAVNLGPTAAPFTVPAVGSNVTITLAANYTAGINTVVSIGTGNYIVVAVGAPPSGTGGYEASVKNLNDTAGNTLAIGTPVISPGGQTVLTRINGGFYVPTNTTDTVDIGFLDATWAAIGKVFTISGRNYRVKSTIGPFPKSRRCTCDNPNTSGSTVFVASGTDVTDPSTSNPSYTIGGLVAAVTVPTVNSSVSIFLDALYAGPADQPVAINGKNYRITAVAQSTPTPSTTVIVKNLTDTVGNTVASGKSLLTIPELGIGRMGAYGHGRNWMALIDGISFTASDLVGESSGSSAYNYRDAVLKTTKNNAIAGGKPFRVPNAGETIQGMSFPAQLDTSLGQGPLLIFTDQNVFSCNAPVDATTWANLTYPLETEALKGAGGVSQSGIVNSNADIRFRSRQAIRSLLIARLDFDKWGNTGISHEMERVISKDDTGLLQFCSAVEFDNRLLMTCSPVQSPRGVYHRGLLVINDDEISSLSDKSPSVYDGLWTGLNILQLIKGTFGGAERVFAFCANTDTNTIELWELLATRDATADILSPAEARRTTWAIESADLFRGERGELVSVFKALEDGEMAVDDAQGRVDIAVYYKPDQYPGWMLWHEWSIETEMFQPNAQPGYFPRMGLGKPSSQDKNNLTNFSSRYGYTFQVRVVLTGHCRFLGMRVAASKQPQPQFAKPICGDSPQKASVQIAPLDDFALYSLQ